MGKNLEIKRGEDICLKGGTLSGTYEFNECDLCVYSCHKRY